MKYKYLTQEEKQIEFMKKNRNLRKYIEKYTFFCYIKENKGKR